MATFDEFERKLQEAKSVHYLVEQNANQMARLLDGHLRSVSHYTLSKLKKQLRDFNIHTGKWSDQ